MNHSHARRIAALVGILAFVAAGCGGGGGSGAQQDSATIRLSDSLPETHFISKDFSQKFLSEAKAAAKANSCDLKIEFFPDGQLGEPADQIDNMTNNVFDMGLVASPYDPDKMPLGDVFNLPFLSDSAGSLAMAYFAQMQDEKSAIYKRDFKDNKLVPVAAFALPLYQVALTSKFTSLDALKGKRIRSGGGVQNDIIEALGGTPVTLTTSEQYEGLQRGIIDGGIFNTPAMRDNKTAEVLSHFTSNASLGGFNGGLAISESTWSSLPDCAKDVLTEAGVAATEHFADMIDELGKEAAKQLVDDYDLTDVALSDSELGELRETLAPVKQKWVKEVASRKADGALALKEAESTLKDLE